MGKSKWECIHSLNRVKFHCRILNIKCRLEAINKFLTPCRRKKQCFQNSSAAGLIYHLHPYKKQLKNISCGREAASSDLSCWIGIT